MKSRCKYGETETRFGKPMSVENDNPTSAVRRVETTQNAIAPENLTISELEEELEEVEDVDEIEELLEAEQDSKDRKGAVEAAQTRAEELTEDEEEEEESTFEHREPSVSEDGAGDVKKVCFARMLADDMGCERNILYGVDNSDSDLDAFTDGDEYIALTESAMDRGYYITWTQQIFRNLIAMWAHEEDSIEVEEEDGYEERYVQLLEQYEEVLMDTCDEFWMNSTNQTLKDAGYHPDQVFDN